MIQWTGESRLDLVNFACKVTNANSYLEIGCNTNEVFDRVLCPNKTGVDPRRVSSKGRTVFQPESSLMKL